MVLYFVQVMKLDVDTIFKNKLPGGNYTCIRVCKNSVQVYLFT